MFSRNSYFSGKDKLFESRRERIEQEQERERERERERSTSTENGARERRTEQQL